MLQETVKPQSLQSQVPHRATLSSFHQNEKWGRYEWSNCVSEIKCTNEKGKREKFSITFCYYCHWYIGRSISYDIIDKCGRSQCDSSACVKVHEPNRISLCFRETSWEWRFCPWRLNRPHTWRWTSQCSVFTWSIGCWASRWSRQKHPCPSASPYRGRRFTTTSHEVRVGELCGFVPVCFYKVWISKLL